MAGVKHPMDAIPENAATYSPPEPVLLL